MCRSICSDTGCFFLVLRIFWEEQLAEQFWYFNFSFYLVVFWAEQSKKPPCTLYNKVIMVIMVKMIIMVEIIVMVEDRQDDRTDKLT